MENLVIIGLKTFLIVYILVFIIKLFVEWGNPDKPSTNARTDLEKAIEFTLVGMSIYAWTL